MQFGGFNFGPDGSPVVGDYVGYASLFMLAIASIVWSARRWARSAERGH
jgi:hypothetical protein